MRLDATPEGKAKAAKIKGLQYDLQIPRSGIEEQPRQKPKTHPQNDHRVILKDETFLAGMTPRHREWRGTN